MPTFVGHYRPRLADDPVLVRQLQAVRKGDVHAPSLTLLAPSALVTRVLMRFKRVQAMPCQAVNRDQPFLGDAH